MAKQFHRPNVSKGILLPLGNGFSLAIGKNPNKKDDIDIGPNDENGITVSNGEILRKKGNTVMVYSDEPMLNGKSPAYLLYRGANPDVVFAAQEQFKKANRIKDNGSHYENGGQNGIYIKPSKRGTFTAAAKKHGMSVQGFANKVLANKENYSSAMIKKANFAKNASKWHHLFGGEDTSINPLGERPNANNENMSNKRIKAVAGTQQPLRTLAEIQAAKEQFGKYYNIFYNNDGTIKRQIPTFGELTGTTLSKADQIMYRTLWGNDFYNRNVDSSGKFVGSGIKPITLNNDDIYANQIKVGDKTIHLNQDPNTGNYIEAHLVNGNNTLLRDKIVPPTTQPTNNNINDVKNNWFKDNKADLVGAGINALGSIGGAIINAIGIGKQRYIPRRGITLTPSKLKTKININPQLAQMREMLSQIEQGARNNSASSRNVYDRILRARGRGIQSYNSLLGDKENRETALINQDRLNQQQVRAHNVQNFQNIMNTNIAGREALNNRKAEAHAENAVALLNNLSGIVTGERGLLAREDARRRTAADLTMMSLAYPDAAKLITEHPELHDQFYNNYYGMLGSNRFYRRRNG